jgi:hypothetical protein
VLLRQYSHLHLAGQTCARQKKRRLQWMAASAQWKGECACKSPYEKVITKRVALDLDIANTELVQSVATSIRLALTGFCRNTVIIPKNPNAGSTVHSLHVAMSNTIALYVPFYHRKRIYRRLLAILSPTLHLGVMPPWLLYVLGKRENT